jgi:hypothetical protein
LFGAIVVSSVGAASAAAQASNPTSDPIKPYAWEEPDFLKLFEAKGESISLQEGDGKSVDVVPIRSASHEQEKR